MVPVRLELCGGAPAREAGIVRAAKLIGVPLERSEVSRIYLLDRDPGESALERLRSVVADPVIERGSWAPASGPSGEPTTGDGTGAPVVGGSVGSPTPEAPTGRGTASPGSTVEVGRLPGVTDAEARELEAIAERLGLGPVRAASATGYRLSPRLSPADLERVTRAVLANPTVDRWTFGPLPPAFSDEAGAPHRGGEPVETVPMRDLPADRLEQLSRTRLLSLDRDELAVIQRFFADAGRDPTDAELETLAQTWSEHCLHKTFRARIELTVRDADGEVRRREVIDGLLDQHLRAATDAIAAPWVRSAFVDNAGIVAFDDDSDLAIKVETHNHPSALEPFGGANTGVGGVVRDVIGVSARPIACLDVLCFAPPDTPAAEVPEGVLHPRRVADGVIAGVGDYGNKLGLPTVAGAVVYHPGYLGNPLVYCGAVGLLPHGSHPRRPVAGDLVVVVGGRTGRDGIHGATFSSADLAADTGDVAASAVQIGDPITEKQVMELVDLARDEELYSAITDCGAGGFSSAVGELAAEVGVHVDLSVLPRKYPGLRPWEVWLSESQERMVLAVPESSWRRLEELATRLGVEATRFGHLTGDERLVVTHGDELAVDLPMAFLHGGCPRRSLVAEWREPARPDVGHAPAPPADGALAATLLALLADPTVASKEAVIRTYDHEVRGGTVVRPWCGPAGDGPTDGAVCVPLGHWETGRAFALGVGINPRYGVLDPYRMAFAAVDEAFRNLVAVGADPDRVALLDNFCWGNPTLPDRLGGLVLASQGCHDAALAYRAPFVSGKDSLFNEFEGRPIPGTLLITGLAIVPDRGRALTSAPTGDGQLVYLVGETRAELGGSLWAEHATASTSGTTPSRTAAERASIHGTIPAGGEVPAPPGQPLDRYRAVHRAVRAGLVRAAHDPSEGGLGVALAELCLAGSRGVSIEPDAHDGTTGSTGAGREEGELAPYEWLFSESLGRLLLVVDPADRDAFEATLAGQPLRLIGRVGPPGEGLRIRLGDRPIVDLTLAALEQAWRTET
jgi:phosphoribosylformylglycinamidine synthase